LLAERIDPSGNPDRASPKSCITQVKASGKIKRRGLTDPGAPRQRRVQLRDGSWQTFETEAQLTKAIRFSQLIVVDAAKKGPPGVDSINATMRPEQEDGCEVDFEYGSAKLFMEMLGILCTSGVSVDCIYEDFSAHYEQLPVDYMEHWYTTQMVSEFAETDPMGCFGYRHCPEVYNRHNYMMNELITKRQRRAQASFNWCPWSAEMRRAVEAYTENRRRLGGSGDWFVKNGWFDDNQCACLRPFTETAKRLQREFWDEFNFKYADEKAATNLYETTVFETALGVEFRARERRCQLPDTKVQTYSTAIDGMLRTAAEHKQSLVPRETVEQAVGRAIHTCDAAPDTWIYLISLLALLAMQRSFEHYVKFNNDICEMFAAIRSVLHEGNGRPLVSYHYRPGADGLPVVETWTDASRRTSTFFGAAGGYFRLRGTKTVFFFTYKWPEEHVQECNIGELEMKAAEIAARLADDVMRNVLHSTATYYLYQFGDNEAMFQHALNSFHSGRPGARFLTHRRAKQERDANRLLTAAHVFRTENTLADMLANQQTAQFLISALALYPDCCFQQLIVPPHYADLSPLVSFKRRADR
jgi:hypothetical protein